MYTKSFYCSSKDEKLDLESKTLLTHTYIHTYIHTYMRVCVRACVCMYVCMYFNAKLLGWVISELMNNRTCYNITYNPGNHTYNPGNNTNKFI